MSGKSPHDVQQRLFEHTQASIQCHGWLSKALKAEQDGDNKKAKLYRAKAKACMQRMIRLEGKI